MNLNIVVRGQSNAIFLMELNGWAGAGALTQEVSRLLGFNTTGDTVSLIYDPHNTGRGTAFGATSLIGDWLEPRNGDWRQGWVNDSLEWAILNRLNDLPASQKDDPTAIFWLHSEYDSSRSNLTAEEWASAVRHDAQQVRQILGQGAGTTPYLFASAMPYNGGSDTGHQAIRRGMEQLAADGSFNGHIAVRMQDIDADLDNYDGNPFTSEFGGGHIDEVDAAQTVARAARSIAEAFAAYARPGSPVALAGGNLADEGPQVFVAQKVGPNQLRVDVRHDQASGFLALDADAAAGVGWSVRGPSGTVNGRGAQILDGDTLLLTFSGEVPADGRLYYGYGYGRLAGAGGDGRGNAVYDNQGLPIWVRADGLAVAQGASGPAGGSDFNGDGTSDLLFRAPGGAVEILTTNGGRSVLGGASAGTYWAVVDLADLNADGSPDLLWRGQGGEVVVWGTSGGAVTSAAELFNPGPSWRIAGTGDFNGDGRDDIVWRGPAGEVFVWTMNGPAITSGVELFNPGNYWLIAGTGDFNDDGRADILWRGQGGEVAVWTMNGPAIAAAAFLVNPGAYWNVAGIADFNADGVSDLLWRGQGGEVAMWIMNGASIASASFLTNPGGYWNIAGTGDFNSDDRADIVWRGQGGEVVVWEMNGASLTGSQGFGLLLPTDWQILTG